MKDYYKILQVSPDAAPEVIQMAYKALAKKYHPDLNPDHPDEAQEKMKELNEAFETLSDSEKRAKYNSSYHSAKQETPPPNEPQKEKSSASASEESKPHTSPAEPEPNKEEKKPEAKDSSSDAGTSVMFLLVDIFCLAIAGLVIFFAFKLGGALLRKIFGGRSSSSSIVREVENEPVEEQAEPLTYKWEQFSNYGSTYTLSENPYYLDGVSRYVDMVNQFYTSLQTSNSKQTVTQTTLEQALKDAGVSSSLIRGLSKKQNVDILQDSDFYRVDADTSNGLVATLFDGETERAYLEVSSTAKDAIGSDETVMFYYGDLKDNKPEGNGALFSYSKASGLVLNYAGQFKEGKMSGKGVRFAHALLGYVLTEAGESEKNQLNGSGTQYRYEDSLVIYQLYQDKFAEYTNTILSTKSEDEANQLCEHILEKNPAVELFLTASNYDIARTTFDFNEAVICPYIEYKGDFKYAKYNGKGKFYAPGGWLAYDGAWTNGKYNGRGTLYNDDGSHRKKGDFDHEEIGDELTYVTLSYGVLDLYSNVNLDELFVTDVSDLASDTSPEVLTSAAVSNPTTADVQSSSIAIEENDTSNINECSQEIVIQSSGSNAELSLMTYRNGEWMQDYHTTAAIGSNGITYNKPEGDHKTPAGTFPILFAFSTVPQNTKLPFVQITEDSVWVCDPNSSYYNTLQSQNSPSRDWAEKGGAEKMYVKFSKQSSTACICFGFNGDGQSQYTSTANGGSALFIDGVGANGNMYSGYGDIKISSSDMEQLLAMLDPSLNPVITVE